MRRKTNKSYLVSNLTRDMFGKLVQTLEITKYRKEERHKRKRLTLVKAVKKKKKNCIFLTVNLQVSWWPSPVVNEQEVGSQRSQGSQGSQGLDRSPFHPQNNTETHRVDKHAHTHAHTNI